MKSYHVNNGNKKLKCAMAFNVNIKSTNILTRLRDLRDDQAVYWSPVSTG